MKGITNYLLSIVFLLPAALLGQSTQVLQDLLQAQMLYPLSQKYIVVNASDTGQFRIKYDNQISFVTPFQALKVGCSSHCQNYNRLCWAIVESAKSLASDESIIYETPFFVINNQDTVGVSNLFYIKISSKSDTILLKRFAQDQNVEIIGFNQNMPLWYTLSCSKFSQGNALEIVNVSRSTRLFEHCEPDLLAGNRLANYNDPYFPYQWGMSNVGQDNGIPSIDINVIHAYKITNGDAAISIAVLDQGFELDHPDLCSISPYSYDTEFDTCPSKVWGIHGTPCAGIIGAAVNNNIGISGIAPNSPLMSISNRLHLYVPDENQKLANGINQAWKHNAAVISNSWRYPFDSCNFISDAIDSAVSLGRNGKGCVVVFSAGNNNDTVSYPACLDNVMAIGAVDRCGARSGRIDHVPESCETWNLNDDIMLGSAWGEQLDVVAPGTHIYTTDRQADQGYNTQKGVAGNYYDNFNGTSAACPHVAGVAALMLSVNPNLKSQEVRDIIEQTARKIRRDLYSYTDTLGHPNGEWNMYMGYGLVDAHRAVLKAAYHKVYGDTALTLCDTNIRAYTVRAPHNANIDSVSFFWTCSDNLQTVAGQNTDSVWVKRIHGGTGQLQCHIIHDGDTVTSSIEIPVVADYTVYDNVSLSNDITYPDTFVLSREIAVDSLAGLTWQNKTVLCTPDCRIIIRPGGMMTINHTVLTSACPNRMWQGVEVTGNSTKQQILHNQGYFFMENGSVISNAYTAVRNSLATDNAYTTTGGVIHATSSFFRNNRRAVEINPYAYSAQSGLVSDYATSFHLCSFIVNDQNLFAANDTVFTEHVKLWDVKGILFEGCRFIDSVSVHTVGSRGVYAEDAGVLLDTRCDANYLGYCECPEEYATYSSFSGFTTAVEVNTAGNPYPVTFNQVQFSDNGTGVRINGNNYATVTRCDFDLQNAPASSANVCGLNLNGCTGYLVEENTFHRESVPATNGRTNYKGIVVSNSGYRSNLLHRNDFSRLSHGVYAANDNTGLLLTCCSFLDNLYGIYVSTGTGISSVQGSVSEGADNSFKDNVLSDFHYSGTPSASYYYSAVGNHTPTNCYGVTLFLTKKANSCASTLCNNEPIKSLAGFLSDMNAYTTALAAAANTEEMENGDSAEVETQNFASLRQSLSETYYAAVRTLMSDSLLDLGTLEQWHVAAQPVADPYSLTETRFCEGYSETFAADADDAEMANYAEFHAMKVALRDNGNSVGANNDSPLQSDGHVNWYALTSGQIAQLQTIAERNTGRASVMAKGVLCFFFGICYEDEDYASETDPSAETRAKHVAIDDEGVSDTPLRVWPNPTDDLLFVELPGAEIAGVALYDLQGRVVGANNYSPLHGTTATMNLRHIPAGVYVLRVTDADGKEYHRKIVRK